MCGRLNIQGKQLVQMVMYFLEHDFYPAPDIADDYNLAPTQSVSVLRLNDEGSLECRPMRWWLTPSWSPGPSARFQTFNARIETAASSKAFGAPFARQRCVVPISGYYEWTSKAGQKVPFFIRGQGEQGLWLAGIWDAWQPRGVPQDEPLYSFALLTSAARGGLGALHPRQPLILDGAGTRQWLDAERQTSVLVEQYAGRLPISLRLDPVSSWVNNARHKGERCHQAIGPPELIASDDQHGARSLLEEGG